MNVGSLLAFAVLLSPRQALPPAVDLVAEASLTKPDPELSTYPELAGHVWCATAPGNQFFLMEGKGVVRLYSGDRPLDRTRTAWNPDGTSTVTTTSSEATAGLYAIHEWRIPAWNGPNPRQSSGVVILAPWKADGIWLVDTERRALLRLDGNEWGSPIAFRDSVGSAVAAADGRLVVNTPDAPGGAFAILGRDGSVERRFGTRRSALLGNLLGYFNTWRLVRLPDGELVAAHAYANLVRRYSADGRLMWERPLKIAEAERLESKARLAMERISRGVDPCCVKAELVTFASAVLRGDGDHVLVRLGGSPVLYELDGEGNAVGRIGVSVSGQAIGWDTAGLARVGDRLVAVERGGAVVYRQAKKLVNLHGRVVTEGGRELPGAAVSVSTPGGVVLKAESDEAGRFAISGLPAGTAGEVRVEADGYLETMLSGIVRDLLARPIVLAKRPVLCVVVRSSDSRQAVTDYRLSVLQSLRSLERASLRSGPERSVHAPDGKACLSAPFAGPWLVRVRAAGFATGEVRIAEAGEAEIALATEARIAVDVTDFEERPVKDVQLFVEDATKEERSGKAITDDRVTKTDADGHGAFEGLPAGEYRITASKEGYLVGSAAVVASEGPNSLKVRLSGGAKVSVLVTNDESRPIAGAEVEVAVQGATTPRAPRCVTDESGRCVTEGVPPGSASVLARGPDGATGRAVATIGEADREASVEVVMRTGVRIEGTVAGVENWPDSELIVQASAVGIPVQEAAVSDRGAFTLSHVPPGKVAFFVFARKLGSNLHFESVEVPRQPVFDVVLRLPPPILLSGQVTRAGVGCGTCSVTALRLGADGGRPELGTGASADGRYALTIPTRGRYQVVASDLASNLRDSETVTLEEDFELNLELRGGTVAGTVFLRNGKPAADADVAVTDEAGSILADGVADDLGRFRLGGVTQGSRRVTARLRTATASRVVVVGSEEAKADLVLSDESAIRLRLFDSENGAPVTRAAVRVLSARGEVSFQPDARADSGQEFSIPAPGTGPWTAVVGAPGYALKTIRQLSAGDAPVAVPVVLRYRAFTVEVREESGIPCSFQLLDAAGLPIAMSIFDLPGPVPLSVRQAFFNQFEPGGYTAVLGYCNGKTASAPLQLQPGKTGLVRF